MMGVDWNFKDFYFLKCDKRKHCFFLGDQVKNDISMNFGIEENFKKLIF
jgi:hypothetical protein